MVSKTNKHRKNVGRNKTIKKKKLEKKCVTDDEMGKICTTGQYSTYEGNFYNNKKNIEIFKKIGKKFSDDKKYKKFKTHKQRYNQFLKENFEEKNIPKVIHQIKNDYYSFANTEWFKENDIEKKEKKYYVQIDDFRIIQEEVYYKLISYVKDFVKANPHSKKAKAINNVYRSLVDNTIKSMYKHVDVIKQLLSKPVDLKDDFGIIIASRAGFLQIVELLLSKGANPNVKDNYLDSPLIAASEMGHLNVVQLLLTNGAKFDVIDKHRKTPIMLASEHGRIHVVDFLLKNGANLNDKDDKGETSIVLASGAGYKNVVELLLKSGVKDNIQLAMDKARKFNHGEIVKLLQSKIKSGGKTRFVRNKITRRKTQKK